MDDALIVSTFERLGNLDGDRHGFVERNGTLHNAIGERGSFDELHDDRPHAQP